MLRRLELSPAMHDELISHAARRGIEFMSTAFDEESVDLLAGKGLKRFKVPSGEIANLDYLRRIAAVAEEVIISTGMATLAEIGAAIAVFEAGGVPRSRITILHCTTDYPARMQDVNLRAMLTIASEFGVQVGYSDHTQGVEVSIAAVALGARIIEKHFTLDQNLLGPDHKASLTPEQLAAMVSAVRNIGQALGDGVRGATPNEARWPRSCETSARTVRTFKPSALGYELSFGPLVLQGPCFNETNEASSKADLIPPL
jgi:N,N'-diacetyllegionaminate synthase